VRQAAISSNNRAVDQAAVDSLVAAAHSEPAVAERILSRNQGISTCRSSWGETGIEAASHRGHKGLVWRFIEAGAELDVFAACALADWKATVARYDPERPDACGIHGLPLLHFAIMSKVAVMLEALLRAGVAVNPKCAALPPLHSAVASGRYDFVRLLLHAGANTMACDSSGATALDWAIDLDGAMSQSVRDLLMQSRAT
jgi:ankyrin repeat protein